MLAHSYLILSPNQPADIDKAVATQRQSVPFAWALVAATPQSVFHTDGGKYYFQVRVGDALSFLDRCLAGWNYNGYFRDTLAPIGVFRNWLGNNTPDTMVHINVTELISSSPNAQRDLEELKQLGHRAHVAIEEIEDKEFSNFLKELRKITFPFITIPITGDRQVDLRILSYEVRDASSVEAEMALQMVGVDRPRTLLRAATESVQLRKKEAPADTTPEPATDDTAAAEQAAMSSLPQNLMILFTINFDDARRLLVDELGCTIQRHSHNRLLLNAHGKEFMVVRVREDHVAEHPIEDHRYSE
ncbi:MAG: hypothetical protein IPM61_16040 [Chlorobi bacterium]|nr:MAG: hypothetical protein UZ07_CHB004001072 [Chlorobi bacterium OLB7]MBK8912819.1 hypothetical protein [Chlorobiota bacterium]